MLRKITIAALAVFLTTAAWVSLRASNIPLFSPTTNPTYAACEEASQTINCLNALIGQINSGVYGYYASVIGPVQTTTQTLQTLGSVTIPTSTISVPGQGFHARCYGNTSSDILTKTINLSFGGFTVSTGAFGATSATNAWELELFVTAATATNTVGMGRGSYQGTVATTSTVAVGAVTVTPVATNDLVDNLASPIIVKCAAQEGAGVASATMENMYIEKVQ